MPVAHSGFSTVTQPGSSARSRTVRADAPSTTCTRATPAARTTATACSTRGRPAYSSSAFGRPPSRRPPPAASTTPVTSSSDLSPVPPGVRAVVSTPPAYRTGAGGRAGAEAEPEVPKGRQRCQQRPIRPARWRVGPRLAFTERSRCA